MLYLIIKKYLNYVRTWKLSKKSALVPYFIILVLGLVACDKKPKMDADFENLTRAKSLINQGDLSTARIELLNALQINPNNPVAFHLFADIYHDLGLFENAAEALRQAQSLSGKRSADLTLQIHRMLILAGSSSSKDELINLQGLSIEQKQEQESLLGHLYLIDNELDKAEQSFKKVINSENPFVAEAYFGLAMISLKTNSTDIAFKLLDKSLKADPKYIESLLATANLYFKNGDLEKAEDFYTRTMMTMKQLDVMTPKKYIALSGLVEVLNKQGKAIQALTYSDILARSRPGKLKSNYENALSALASKDIKKAKSKLETVLGMAPDHPQTNYLVGLMEMETGDLTKAEIHLTKAMAGEFISEQNRTALIITRLKLKQFEKAEKLINDGLNEDPESHKYLSLKGSYFSAMMDYPEAEKYFLAALKKEKDFLPALMGLAKAYAKQSDFNQAEKYIDQAIEIDLNNIPVLLEKIKYASLNQKLDQAKQKLLRKHSQHPGLISPTLVLASIYLNEKNLVQSKQYLNKAIAINSEHPFIANLQSNISLAKAKKLIVNGHLDDAVANLDQAILEQPKNFKAKVLKAELLTKKGNSQAALAISKDLKSNPETKLIGLELAGNILAQNAQFTLAAEAYSEIWEVEKKPFLAIKLYRIKKEFSNAEDASRHIEDWLTENPKNFYAISTLASVYSENKDYERAVTLFEKASEIRANNPIILNNMAYIYNELQDEKALPTAEKAYQLAPQNPAVSDTYGWILLQNNQIEKALPILATAAKQAPQNKEVLQHYAEALTKAGQEEKAMLVMNKITKI